MYGVVLWSDKEDRKAVIWCEDHGDLAYYSGREESVFDGPPLDTGDFVQFQLSEGSEVRMAMAPRLVAQSQYHGLAESLKAGRTPTQHCENKQMPQHERSDGNVIAFAPRQENELLAS